MLIVNTLEAEILLGYAEDSSSRRSPSASARGMLAYGLLEEMRRLVPKVVLTAGADGAYYTDQKGGWLHVPTAIAVGVAIPTAQLATAILGERAAVRRKQAAR
jgi:hypothetical protein